MNIDSNIYELLKDICKKNGLIMSKIVEKLITEYVEQHKAKK